MGDKVDVSEFERLLASICEGDTALFRTLMRSTLDAQSKKAGSKQKQSEVVSQKAKRKRARKSKSKSTDSNKSDTPNDEKSSSAASKKKRLSKTKVPLSTIGKTALDEAKENKDEDNSKLEAKESTADQATQETKRLKRKRHRKLPKTTMLQALRKYEAAKVKIPKERSQWTREIADTLLEYIRKYCKKEAPDIFSHLEYTGSFYENLKTGDADEIDIMLALDTKSDAHLTIEDVNLPGYARIKAAKGSKYRKPKKKDKLNFATGDGYIRPNKIRSHFFSLVQKAVNEYKKDMTKEEKVKEEKAKLPSTKDKKSGIDGKRLNLKVRDNGPAITLVIENKSMAMKLSVDLVPAFLFKEKKADGAPHAEAKHYVAKVPLEELVSKHELPKGCKREMLWRRSFSLDEKKKMQNLDKDDKSCRRAVVKILKTIVKSDSTLAKLSSFHVKTAFLHYNFDDGQAKLEWSKDKLEERIKGLMEYLLQSIKDKNLTNFFIPELNLLEELENVNLVNIDGRLTKLLENENELRRILFVEHSELSPSKTSKSLKPAAKKRKVIRDLELDDIFGLF